LFGPDLSLADTEQIFFVLLIDFDFPTIEVGLEHLNHIGSRIGDQQVSGLAIEPMPVSVIGQGGDDDQAEGPALGGATPENRADGVPCSTVSIRDLAFSCHPSSYWRRTCRSCRRMPFLVLFSFSASVPVAPN